MAFDWKAVVPALEKIGLPLLGTALLGPGGAVLGEGLATAIGKPGAGPDDVLRALTTDAESQEKAREFDLTNKTTILQINVNAEIQQSKIDADDRASARAMQNQTKSKVPAFLAIFITLSLVTILVGMLLGKFDTNDHESLLLMLGSLTTAWGAVMNYYFGSSSGSAAKTELAYQERAGNTSIAKHVP